MNAEQQINYNLEVKLSVPDGIPLDKIHIRVEIEPTSAGCLIYGWLADGDLGYVKVHGARSDISLPFVNRQIYIKYLENVKNIKVSTLGWSEPRGQVRPSPVPQQQKH